jgi:hypothetical protein
MTTFLRDMGTSIGELQTDRFTAKELGIVVFMQIVQSGHPAEEGFFRCAVASPCAPRQPPWPSNSVCSADMISARGPNLQEFEKTPQLLTSYIVNTLEYRKSR